MSVFFMIFQSLPLVQKLPGKKVQLCCSAAMETESDATFKVK